MIDLRLGDCLEVMRTLPGESVDLVATDPPYGIDYHHGNHAREGIGEKRSGGHVEWGSIDGDEKPDGRWLTEVFRVLKIGSAVYVLTRWDVEPEWRVLLTEAGFTVKQRLIWHKRVHGKGDLRGTYATTCEDVLFASKGRHVLNRRPSMLLDVGCVPTWEYRYHPHQKPVELLALLIETSTRPGATILDPYMGSGTTGIACLNTGRNFIGIEIDPAYHAIAESRIRSAMLPLFQAQ